MMNAREERESGRFINRQLQRPTFEPPRLVPSSQYGLDVEPAVNLVLVQMLLAKVVTKV
jgi:hypothetical protein